MNTLSSFGKHLPHYLPLLGIYVFGACAFWLFSYDRGFQTAVAVALAVSHVTWGLIHHWMHKDLSLEVAVEYFTVAALGLTVMFTIIYRI